MRIDMISDSVQLWGAISRIASFEDSDYDLELKESIRQKLGLPQTGKMESLLKEYGVTSEQLIGALLHAIEAFSLMMSDVLCMFKKANAQNGNTNLSIKFDFETYQDKFDLDFFKKQLKNIDYVCQNVKRYLVEDPWELERVVCPNRVSNWTNFPQGLYSEQIEEWLRDYFLNRRWPESFPKCPQTGIEKLDLLIQDIWRSIEKDIIEFRKLGITENSRKELSRIQSLRIESEYLSRRVLAETDGGTGVIVHAVAELVREILNMPYNRRCGFVDDAINRIETYLSNCPKEMMKIEKQIEEIITILNMPFWKKRHELYSVWIGAQIVDALEWANIRFNIFDNTLSFSFGGSCFATCLGVWPPMEIWAELKTEYKTPIGKNRKGHIQPDYSLAVSPATCPNNSIAVVECKQYKRQNKRNFVEAVLDYANGRPQAFVMLASYGPISNTLYTGVERDLGDRISMLGLVKPNSIFIERFKSELAKSVKSYYYDTHKRNSRVWRGVFHFPILIELKWDAYPSDLDLYLRITDEYNKSINLSYQNKGKRFDAPYAELNHDCTNGYGDERITIQKWYGKVYDVFVNNYSGGLGKCRIDASINMDGRCITVSRNNAFEGNKYWHVFSFSEDGLQIIDSIVSDI